MHARESARKPSVRKNALRSGIYKAYIEAKTYAVPPCYGFSHRSPLESQLRAGRMVCRVTAGRPKCSKELSLGAFAQRSNDWGRGDGTERLQLCDVKGVRGDITVELKSRSDSRKQSFWVCGPQDFSSRGDCFGLIYWQRRDAAEQ